MPLYEYRCLNEGHHFERRQAFSEDPITSCPECGGEVRRVIQPVGVVFKGSGFYATDSRKSRDKQKPPGEGSKDKPPRADGKSETTGESKPDAGAEQKSSAKVAESKEGRSEGGS